MHDLTRKSSSILPIEFKIETARKILKMHMSRSTKKVSVSWRGKTKDQGFATLQRVEDV